MRPIALLAMRLVDGVVRMMLERHDAVLGRRRPPQRRTEIFMRTRPRQYGGRCGNRRRTRAHGRSCRCSVDEPIRLSVAIWRLSVGLSGNRRAMSGKIAVDGVENVGEQGDPFSLDGLRDGVSVALRIW